MLSLDDLHKLADTYSDLLGLKVHEFKIGKRLFSFNSRPHLMGVINLSPDSWYRESVCLHTDQAVERGQRLVAEGADIVDIGAESTILHANRVDRSKQIKQLLPIIRGLSQKGVLVSIETYHPSIVRACLEAGASVINLTGTIKTTDIFRTIAEHHAAVILCYVEGKNARAVKNFSLEEDMIPRMETYFSKKIEEAVHLGVRRIILDPGLGFYYHNLQDSATRIRHQIQTFLNTFRLRKLGWPICHALPHAFEYFADEVRSAEPFFAVLALLGKTDLLRTHEVAKVRAVCRTLNVWET